MRLNRNTSGNYESGSNFFRLGQRLVLLAALVGVLSGCSNSRDTKIKELTAAAEKGEEDMEAMKAAITELETRLAAKVPAKEDINLVEHADALEARVSMVNDDGEGSSVYIYNRVGPGEEGDFNRIRGINGRLATQSKKGGAVYDSEVLVDGDLIAMEDRLRARDNQLQAGINGNVRAIVGLGDRVTAGQKHDENQRKLLETKVEGLEDDIEALDAKIQGQINCLEADLGQLRGEFETEKQEQDCINAIIQRRLCTVETGLTQAQMQIAVNRINIALLAARPNITYHYQVCNNYRTYINQPVCNRIKRCPGRVYRAPRCRGLKSLPTYRAVHGYR